MARTQYAPKHTYLGDGSTTAYTFDFKIEALSQLLVVVMDDNNEEVQRVRGDDTSYLDSVDFDPVLGAGTVNLLANLPTDYTIIILEANDAPTQPYQFSNKLSFNLKTIEKALDFITGAVQRLAYLAGNSIRIHESDEGNFNTQFPPDMSSNAGKYLNINDTGDAFEFTDVGSSALQSPINVTVTEQGQYSSGDVIPSGTDLEEIIRNMLTSLTPPVFSLAGSGAKVVESGTTINPVLTPMFTQNDGGTPNAYELTKDAVSLYTDATPTPYTDTGLTLVDDSVVYEATVDLDASTSIPATTLTSNSITYTGVRAAFFQVGGDAVNIRSNSEKLVGVQSGSQLVTTGDGSSLDAVFAYPDSLGDPTSLFLSNTGGNFDISSDLVRETDQSVNDASGGNPVTYRVYSYTALIPIEAADTLTFTI